MAKDNTVYKQIRWQIESGYKWGSGMDRETHDKFYEDIGSIFEQNGWSLVIEGHNGRCPVYTKNNGRLYVHPMEITGSIAPDDIEPLSEALEHGETFSVDFFKVFGDCYNWTDEEYREYLGEQREKMAKYILDACITKRRNLFKPFGHSEMFDAVKHCGSVSRIGKYGVERAGCGSDLAIEFMKKVRDELIAEGKLTTGNTKYGICYRTA